MAKKKTNATRGTKTAKTSTPKKTKKAAPAKALLALDALPPDRQASLFRAVEAAIRKERVSGTLTALHFDTSGFGIVCPPGKARRTVCRKAGGRVVCNPECV